MKDFINSKENSFRVNYSRKYGIHIYCTDVFCVHFCENATEMKMACEILPPLWIKNWSLRLERHLGCSLVWKIHLVNFRNFPLKLQVAFSESTGIRQFLKHMNFFS